MIGNLDSKDSSITLFLSTLTTMGYRWVAKDHWEGDGSAIGISCPKDPGRLAYVSSWLQPADTYYIELEMPAADGLYDPVVKASAVPLVDAARLVGRHIDPSGPEGRDHELGGAPTSTVQFPYMRDEVIGALRSLADAEHQRERWGVVEEGVNYYDDLTLTVNVLYDDTMVLPNPAGSVGAVIHAGEVEVLRKLGEELSPLLDAHGDEPDTV